MNSQPYYKIVCREARNQADEQMKWTIQMDSPVWILQIHTVFSLSLPAGYFINATKKKVDIIGSGGSWLWQNVMRWWDNSGWKDCRGVFSLPPSVQRRVRPGCSVRSIVSKGADCTALYVLWTFLLSTYVLCLPSFCYASLGGILALSSWN